MAMNDPDESKALVATKIRVPATLDPAAGSTNPFGRAIVAPKVVSDAGDRAARRFANFFSAQSRTTTLAPRISARVRSSLSGAIAATWRWRISSRSMSALM